MIKKMISLLCVLTWIVDAGAQALYVPGGATGIQNSNSNFSGLGGTTPTALFQLQQTGDGWSDGLRLSLNGKNWNVLSTSGGNRLVFGLGQAPVLELFSDGTRSAIDMKADVTLKGKAIYFIGDASDPNYLIQSGGWLDGMKYKHYTSHQFFTSGVERFRISYDGRIGINTTAPSGRLHVQQQSDGGPEGIRLAFQAKNWDIVSTNKGDRLAIAPASGQGIEINATGTGPTLDVKGNLDVKGDLQMGQKKAIYFLGSASDPEYLIQSGDWTDGMKYKHFTSHQFYTDRTERVRILKNGNVGIGTTSPDAMLTVRGDIHAREVRLDMAGAVAPDFVFASDYNLVSLDSVGSFIATHHHLPNIPSAAQMEAAGIELKSLNLLLLQKIEELTLYTLELKKELTRQQQVLENNPCRSKAKTRNNASKHSR